MTTTIHDFSAFDLDDRLLDALRDKGYTRPTDIQAQTLPLALEGHNIMGSAPTGTGKTAAFLLPVLQHLLDFPRKKPGAPRILILVPTRELAMQVAQQAEELAKYTNLKISTITGGVAYMNHAEIFSKNQDVVVATTGRLLQYIKEENFDCRAVEIMILDEADRMLDMGFAQDIERIAAETRWREQTLLFSATLEGEQIDSFARRVLEDPIKIEAESSRRERKKILQWYYHADNYEHKVALLRHLLQQPDFEKVIVFVKKRERVHEIVALLNQAGIRNCYLEGEMVQAKRNEAIKRLQNNVVKVLVATDVAARGLDISDVTHVINFDLPKTPDTYLHRIGRTARADKKGTAISLVEAHDYPLLGKVSRYLDETIKARVIDELKPKTKPSSTTATGKKSKAKKSGESKKAKEKKEQKKKKEEEVPKKKIRLRDKKNIGKRRKPSSAQETSAATENTKTK